MAAFIEGCVDVHPQDVQYDEGKVARLEAHYADRVEKGKLQGASFLMARHGKVFAQKAIGNLTREPDTGPLKPDSIKNIASITKVVTATAVMKLVEDGVIWLEQPVKAIIPEFDNPIHGGINIWHLLTHTSGLTADPGYFTEPHPIERWELFGRDDWLVKAVLAGPVQNRPGEQWNYCSIGFTVLAEIVSRVSGRHFNDFVESEIFKPLGMTRSFMEVPKKLWPEVCLSDDWSREALARAPHRKGAPNGGGGVHSTLHDLFTLGQCFLGGGQVEGRRILGKKTCQEMTRNQLCGVPAFHWGKGCKDYRQGLGWGFYSDGPTVGPATYNHEGSGWCSLFVDPAEEFVFVSFIPDAGGWNPDFMVSPRTIAFSGIT